MYAAFALASICFSLCVCLCVWVAFVCMCMFLTHLGFGGSLFLLRLPLRRTVYT